MYSIFWRHAFRLTLIILSFFLFRFSVAAGGEEAWNKLHELQIPEAKRLFLEGLEKSPDDISLMRGMLLASFYDFDHENEAKMIDALIRAKTGIPYLYAIFEHIAANHEGWSDQLNNELKIAQTLVASGDKTYKYIGHKIIGSYCYRSMDSSSEIRSLMVDFSPGFWISGPFENISQIAAYRKVPFEGEPLDTLAKISGKLGITAGWTWLESDPFGNLSPDLALGQIEESAVQLRTFFELPHDMDILILPGGAYGGRILLDGFEIYNDPFYRNAVIRDGMHVSLKGGEHELTIVLNDGGIGAGIGLSITDTNYVSISGFKWLRYADVKYGDNFEVEKINPIFSAFDNFIKIHDYEPDTKYWKSILQAYNGYSKELIQELESAYGNSELTALEVWPLYIALTQNGETQSALEFLSLIKEVSSSPMVDFTWLSGSGSDFESTIRGYVELNNNYPGRPILEASASMLPLLNGDFQGFVDSLMKVAESYPAFLYPHSLLADLYLNSIKNPTAALEQYTEYCQGMNYNVDLLFGLPDYYFEMKKYDDALKAAINAYRQYPYVLLRIQKLASAYKFLHQEDHAIAILDSLHQRYPFNVEILGYIYELYNGSDRYKKANEALEKINFLKPTAVKPYQILDSLHNFISYDSIFGAIDAMELWNYEPTETELGQSNYWYLLDRRQHIIFPCGLELSDIQTVEVLMDQDAVEEMQETNLGFDPDNWQNKLLTARRLRKGQPSSKAQIQGNSAIFQDLQVGDAIELHYRLWRGHSGDLWKDFWDTYLVHTEYYQHFYEYTIMSNREDLKYIGLGPVPAPTEDSYCGFKRVSWQGKNVPAWNLDFSLMSPSSDLVGKIFISTIDNWEMIRLWYRSVSDAVLGKNPRTDQLADSLIAGCQSDMDKLAALYRYIVLEIPYQVIRFNYSAAIPHRPDDVLLNLWGDCKDKGHLLIEMLRHAGIDAWPILTLTRDNGTQIPLPQFEFDHLIAACVIDGDTLYVDASDLTYPVQYCLAYNVSGQPFLPVYSSIVDSIAYLPRPAANDYHWQMNIEISSKDNGGYDFVDNRTYYNLAAGERRYDHFVETLEELKKNFVAYYADIWNMNLSLDSIVHDDPNSIDTIFHETYYGKIELKSQAIGNSTIISPPMENVINRSLLTYIGNSQERQFDIDLKSYVGEYESSFSIKVPDEVGTPQLADDLELTDSLYRYLATSDWDPDSRLFTVNHALEIDDGHCQLEQFAGFIKKVLDSFNTPLLFQK